MLLSSLPKPAVIAHRGASAFAPENTLAAFKLALQLGADAIELDAKLSADKQVVVIHDQTVDRTTTAHGWVKDFTLAELHKMDAGSHFDISFKGEPIPSLDEVFKAVGQLTYINVELTNYATLQDELPAKVAELVKRHKLMQRVFFSSFSPIQLMRIHRLLPEAQIGLLLERGWQSGLKRIVFSPLVHAKAIHPERHDSTPSMIHTVHQKGQRVFVYTVNELNDIQRLFASGVDGIFTDDPILARSVLEKMAVDSQVG